MSSIVRFAEKRKFIGLPFRGKMLKYPLIQYNKTMRGCPAGRRPNLSARTALKGRTSFIGLRLPVCARTG